MKFLRTENRRRLFDFSGKTPGKSVSYAINAYKMLPKREDEAQLYTTYVV